MDFKEWFLSLTDEQRDVFAREAGTTAGYIRVHLIGRRKIPRSELMQRLADASHGRFSLTELLAFFYRTGEHSPPLADDGLVRPQQTARGFRTRQMG